LNTPLFRAISHFAKNKDCEVARPPLLAVAVAPLTYRRLALATGLH
jgi:hypothetical protein